MFQCIPTINGLKKTINFPGKVVSKTVNRIVLKYSSGKTNNEEYLELINNKKHEYFYDNIEEILSNSDNEQINNAEDDERLFNNDDRISFTREQLVEYQQLMKLLRFVKVCLMKISSFVSSINR
jgi:hypothetical protein